MDYQHEQNLFKLCLEEYKLGGLSGIERLVEKFEGNFEEKSYLTNLRDILRLRNGHGTTRILFLTAYDSFQEIKNETVYLSQTLLIEDGGIYLQTKLEEYFFNTSHQRF